MSLVVWLPLNGSLNNQGLCNVTVTNDGTTVDNNGKIGQCYSFNNTHIILDSTLLQNIFASTSQPFSMACWIYLNSDETDRVIIFGNYSANPFVNWELTASCSLRTCVGGTSNYITHSNSTVVPKTTWTHIAFTYDGTKTTFYLNGVKLGTLTGTNTLSSKTASSRFYLGSDARNDATRLKGKMNDFRIYDTCLSDKEVEEISKGLVVHLKLNDEYIDSSSANLITNSNNLLGWSKESTCTIELLSDGFYCIRSTSSSTGSRYGIYKDITLLQNTTYTFSVDVKDRFHIGVTPGTSFAWNTTSNQDTTTLSLYVYTFTTETDNTKLRIYLYGYNKTNGETYVRFPKLEIGGTATPWRLSNSELGNSTTTVYDSSGYEHDGLIINAITTQTDTPRYERCIHMSATNLKVRIQNLITSGFGNSYSFAWWEKISSNDPMHWGFSDGIRLNGMYTGRLWNTGDSSSNPLYNPGTTTQVTAPTVNVWHHWVMTGDGSKCRVYQDGVLWAEAKTYKAISGTSIYINGWDSGTNYCSSNASMSDFRIYATALTAALVKELYDTSVTIDNLGNVHARELIEN